MYYANSALHTFQFTELQEVERRAQDCVDGKQLHALHPVGFAVESDEWQNYH